MERERMNQFELTGQDQNAYSSGMPENTGEADVRPHDYQVSRTPEQVQSGVADWERYYQTHGESIDADTRDALRTLVQAGYVPPDNPNAEVRVAPGTYQPTGSENVDLSQAENQMGGRRRGRRGGGEEEVGMQLINPDQYGDPELKRIAEVVKRTTTDKSILRDPHLVGELLQKVNKRAMDPTVSGDVNRLRDHLEGVDRYVKAHQLNVEEGVREMMKFSLTPDEMNKLQEDPFTWINDELDIIYELSTEGQELSSPRLSEAQRRQGMASKYLTEINAPTEVIKKFEQEFLTKLKVMFARNNVQARNLEGVQGIASQLGTHGIVNSLALEGGMVGMMHNRIQNLYDDIRVRSREHHITAEEHSTVQSRVIREFSELILKDEELTKNIIGDKPISEFKKEQLIRAAVIRSVRTGYDHFVSSQREAIIVARGEHLDDLEGIIADPSGAFLAFNYEQMLVAKFNLLNHEQEEFFSALKRRYAESVLHKNGTNIRSWANERVKQNPKLLKTYEGKSRREAALIDYGETLMKDLMAVNDFYSSGWRVEKFLAQRDNIFIYKKAEQNFAQSNPDEYKRLRGILDQKGTDRVTFENKAKAQSIYSTEVKKIIDSMSADDIRTAKGYAKNFGLFMRLRQIETAKLGKKEHEEAWSAIAKYRPEDIVKFFREKGTEDELSEVNKAFARLGLRVPKEEIPEAETGEEKKAREKKAKLTLYDVFKDEYGAAISLIREKAMLGKQGTGANDVPMQIDFSEIDSNPRYIEYKKTLVKLLAKGDRPEDIVAAEQKVKQIAELYGSLKSFAGDKRTIDSLMHETRFEYITKKTYDVNDLLLDRMENMDEEAGFKQLSKILDSEPGAAAFRRTFNDMEAAQEAYTQMLVFLRSEKTEDKLKASLAAGEAASRYGGTHTRAQAFRYLFGSYVLMGNVSDGGWVSKNMVYELLEFKNLPFNKPVNELQKIFGPQAPAFNNDQMLKFLEEHRGDLVDSSEDKKKAEALWHEMRRLAKTRPRDQMRFLAMRSIIYGMIFLMMEGVIDLKEGLKNEDLN